MPVLDRLLVSSLTAKITSRSSSVMIGVPASGPQPPPVDAAGRPLSRQAAAIRFSVRSLTCPSPSSAASPAPRARSSAALARRRCPSVVLRGS